MFFLHREIEPANKILFFDQKHFDVKFYFDTLQITAIDTFFVKIGLFLETGDFLGIHFFN